MKLLIDLLLITILSTLLIKDKMDIALSIVVLLVITGIKGIDGAIIIIIWQLLNCINQKE